MTHEEWIGKVTHWYPKVEAAAVRLDLGDVHLGDEIHIAGQGVDIVETIESIELDHEPVTDAHAGQEIGIRLHHAVPEHADVFIRRED